MPDFKLLSQQNFDRQAACYDTSSYSLHARKLYPLFLSQLRHIPHASLLDLGCGTGAMLELILRELPGTRCVGLDLSPNMVRAAQGRLPGNVEIVLGDAEALPFCGGSFDVVVCSDSFHHYPSPGAVLAEVRRVLRPGGVLLLGDTTAPWGLRQAVNLLLPFSHGGDVRLYGPEELEGLLSRFFHGACCRRAGTTALFAWGIR